MLEYIGGVVVLNGGFGCLSQTKLARALHDTRATIAGEIDRETLESQHTPHPFRPPALGCDDGNAYLRPQYLDG